MPSSQVGDQVAERGLDFSATRLYVTSSSRRSPSWKRVCA